jgi:hypothetical protein
MAYDAHLYCKFISKGYETVSEYKKLWFPNIKSDDQITKMAELIQNSDGQDFVCFLTKVVPMHGNTYDVICIDDLWSSMYRYFKPE